MLPGRPFPRSVLSVGTVIDDLVLLERCVRGVDLNSIHAAYETALLEANVRDAAVSTFWGRDPPESRLGCTRL